MKRGEFLKGLGIAGLTTGLGSLLPGIIPKAKAEGTGAACSLVPQETAGPYPLDLHTNAAMIRRSIAETQAGVAYTFRIRIQNLATCEGVPNARVDVWHCNAHGNYSGYQTNSGHGNGNVNAIGQTWCRGIQLTDADGWVEFVSIFPGWYNGRVWHIHFQVYLNSTSVAISQFTIPVALKNQIYTGTAPYSQYGADPQAIGTDNIFSDGSSLQMATLEADSATGGYKSEFTASVNTQGLTALLSQEPETGGQFKLGQNYPNPFRSSTTIPYELTQVSDVKLDLWSLEGRKMKELSWKNEPAGEHSITLDLAALGLTQANYYYQLQVSNSFGTYRQAKMMTAQR